MTDLLSHLLTLAHAPTAPDALAVMRLSMVDWLACGIAGRREPVAGIVRDMVLEEAGAGQATLFGGGMVPLRAAALVNGTTSHALDYDDTHFAHIGHPSVAVLPAAMAVAEHVGAEREALTDAALRGTEASVRMGLALGRAHYQIGFHQTATAGAFGAAMAAAVLLELSEDETAQALGLVSTRASGLKSQFGTMGKPYNAGIAASNGVEAALLAARGFLSNPEALAGVNGFLGTHHADGRGAWPQGWLMQDVSHKFHACCHGLHATLEALAGLPFTGANEITAVRIETHPRWLTVCNQPAPATGLGAKFSYRTAAALALLGHNTAALETYSDSLAIDPAVMALRDRVNVVGNDTLSETEARVEVTAGGEIHALAHDLNAPLPLEDRTDRVRAKAAALLGEAEAEAAWRAVTSGTVAEIAALMG